MEVGESSLLLCAPAENHAAALFVAAAAAEQYRDLGEQCLQKGMLSAATRGLLLAADLGHERLCEPQANCPEIDVLAPICYLVPGARPALSPAAVCTDCL